MICNNSIVDEELVIRPPIAPIATLALVICSGVFARAVVPYKIKYSIAATDDEWERRA